MPPQVVKAGGAVRDQPSMGVCRLLQQISHGLRPVRVQVTLQIFGIFAEEQAVEIQPAFRQRGEQIIERCAIQQRATPLSTHRAAQLVQ
ncbi:MAG: hypothetical protein CR964_00125 [Rhodobacterales bacterium]|nr:MAG: hypothetical protein CR964_00125 [Rhodobacterales bacterium]